MSTGSTQHKVRAALLIAADWADVAWISEESGLRRDQVDSALRRMVDNGSVLKLGLGEARKYKLAPQTVPHIDFAFWASGAVSIAKGGVKMTLTADEASELVSFILSPGLRDEFTTFTDAAAAAMQATKTTGVPA